VKDESKTTAKKKLADGWEKLAATSAKSSELCSTASDEPTLLKN